MLKQIVFIGLLLGVAVPVVAGTLEHDLLDSASMQETLLKLKTSYDNYAYNHPEDRQGQMDRLMKMTEYMRTHRFVSQYFSNSYRAYSQVHGDVSTIGFLRRHGYGNLLN